MFLLDDKTELNEAKIVEIIQAFNMTDRPKIQRWKNYFLGKQDILHKQVSNQFKPCNRIISNECANITTTYAGYLTGKDITYSSVKNIDEITKILNYNDVAAEDEKLLKAALVCGVAFEIFWVDKEGKQRFKLLDSRECIPVYSSGLDEELRAVIRYYKIDAIGIHNNKYYVEVYEADRTRKFLTNNAFSALEPIEETPNYYNQVPVVVFPLNEERESIFNKIMTLQDAYNTLISSSVDDWEAFADCYMVLTGMTLGDEEEANAILDKMKEQRIMVLDEGGTAEYLNKDIKTTQIENLLDRIDEKIHTIAACPNFTDEAFGTSSGIALQYKLLGFEDAAGEIEKAMTMALQKRIELICSILSLTDGEEMWRDISITFHRNLPIDMSELVSTISGLKDIVSDETLLAQIPFVDDVNKELKKVKKQKEENKELSPFYQSTLNYQTNAQKKVEEQPTNE